MRDLQWHARMGCLWFPALCSSLPSGVQANTSFLRRIAPDCRTSTAHADSAEPSLLVREGPDAHANYLGTGAGGIHKNCSDSGCGRRASGKVMGAAPVFQCAGGAVCGEQRVIQHVQQSCEHQPVGRGISPGRRKRGSRWGNRANFLHRLVLSHLWHGAQGMKVRTPL